MIEPERLWATLFHSSDCKIGRDEFMDMGVWDLVNVVCRPGRDDRGKYQPESRSLPGIKGQRFGPVRPLSSKEEFKKLFFEMARLRGHIEEDIQVRWEKKHGKRG